MTRHARVWILSLFAFNLLFLGMLGFYRANDATAQDTQVQLPFRNAVEQRQEMIRELQEIRALLKEQNALVRSWLARGDQGGRR